jgi:hypothetical protein
MYRENIGAPVCAALYVRVEMSPMSMPREEKKPAKGAKPDGGGKPKKEAGGQAAELSDGGGAAGGHGGERVREGRVHGHPLPQGDRAAASSGWGRSARGDGHGGHTDYMDLFKHVQAGGKAVQIWGSPDEVKHIHHELRPERAQYHTWASSQTEAEALLRSAMKTNDAPALSLRLFGLLNEQGKKGEADAAAPDSPRSFVAWGYSQSPPARVGRQCGKSARPVRRAGRGDGAMDWTEAPACVSIFRNRETSPP